MLFPLQMQQTKRIIRQKHEASVTGSSNATTAALSSPIHTKRQLSLKSEHSVSLDKIVTEYLRKQHALCRNPTVTCPPFSLFT